jgi:hypothetical protein
VIVRGGAALTALVLAEMTLACSEPPPVAHDGGFDGGLDAHVPRPRVSLVDPERWTRTTEADDPFDDRLPMVVCDETATHAEDLGGVLVYSVDTSFCNYATVQQTSLADVRAGDFVRVRAFHFRLYAREPAEAHIAIRLGAEVLWEERVPIPNDESGPLGATFRASADVPRGTDVYFHLHNHGDNSWAFIELSTGELEPE